MLRTPVLALLLLAAAALAGCAGEPGESGESDGQGRDPAADSGRGSDATMSAAPAAADDPPQPNATAGSVAETPVRVAGSTALGACAASQCHYEMTDTAFGALPPARLGLRLAGTLTWTAASPTSQQLTLYVPTLADGQYHWEPGDPSASGPSPLAFDLDLSGLGSGSLGLIVGNGVAMGTPAGVMAVQTPQEFTLDAVYTALA